MRNGCLKYAGVRRALTCTCLGLLTPAVFGLPQGGEVVQGDVVLQQSEQSLEIHQHSDRAVVNFDSYSVGAQEQVQYHMPKSNSAILNRVTGSGLSHIAGRIDANGQVFLVNPNGIVFHSGSVVSAAALTATTLDISDSDFLNAHLSFAGGDAGRIEQNGNIDADHVVLAAPVVVQNGDIHSRSSTLASANALLIQPDNSGIPVLIEDHATVGNGLVRQNGQINAEAIRLLAPGARIDQRGQLRAEGVHTDGGTITLRARDIHTNGRLSADGEHGGEIHMHADEQLLLAPELEVSANALAHGDGGNIRLFSPGRTLFTEGARLSARGGDVSGDGGFIEVSGLDQVFVFGFADASAPAGHAGEFYIDPIDIVIQVDGGDELFIPDGSGGFDWSPGADTGSSVIDPDAIHASLALGNRITIDTATGSGGTGNIQFVDPIDINDVGSAQLQFLADGSVDFASGSGLFDSDLSTLESVDFTLNAGGNITMASGSSLYTGTGRITMNSGGFTALSSLVSDATGLDAIAITAAGISDDFDNSTRLSAANGGVTLTAALDIGSGDALDVDSPTVSITSTSGMVDIEAWQSTELVLLNTRADTQIRATGDLLVSATLDRNGRNGSTYRFSASNDLLFGDGVGIFDSDLSSADNLDLLLDAGNDLQFLTGAELNAGEGIIHITAGGTVNASGLTSTSNRADAISISAAEIRGDATAGNDLSAVNGGIALTTARHIVGALGLRYEVDTQQLSLTGADTLGRIDIYNPGNTLLTVNALNHMIFESGGTLSVSGNTLDANGDLSLDVASLDNSNTAWNLSAQSLYFAARNSEENISLNLDVAETEVHLAGGGSLSVAGMQDLAVLDLDGDGLAADIVDGDLRISSAGDLALHDHIRASDAIANGLREGRIELSAPNGQLEIGTLRSTLIESLNTAEPGLNQGLDSNIHTQAAALLITLGDNAALNRTLTIGDNAHLRVQGGDLVIDALGEMNTDIVSDQGLVLSDLALLEAYNNDTDALDGQVFVGELEQSATTQWRAHSRRVISLRPGNVPPVPDPEPEPEPEPEPPTQPDPRPQPPYNQDAGDADRNGDQSLLAEQTESPPQDEEDRDLTRNFEQVFGRCHNAGRSEQERAECETQRALQHFLSKWTVGGELPAAQIRN